MTRFRVLLPPLGAALLALVPALGGCGEALATASTVVTTLQQAQTAIDQTLGSPTPTPGASASASPAPGAAPTEVPTIFGIPVPGAR